VSWRLCPACERDPDPRGPSACSDCRELNTKRRVPHGIEQHVAGLSRAVDDYVTAVRLGSDDAWVCKLALHGAVEAYYKAECLGKEGGAS
jgi:hypothetical protein